VANLVQPSDPEAFLRALLRRDFCSFLRKAYPYISGGEEMMWNWHLEAIAYELERVAKGDNLRLLVTLPPRNGKSKTITVIWVSWMLGIDPRRNFVCVSYSNDLSAKLARDCLAIMQAHWYRELFPNTIISPKRFAATDFETTAGGGRLATSVTGTLTGRGGDIVILDDVIKPEEANSETTRNFVNGWYQSTLASRLNDKASGAIITVMQRLHEQDIAGMLIKTGHWHQLKLPAIATEDQDILLPRARIHQRRLGDVLHPAREPLHVLDDLKASMGSHSFAAQYQQEPVPIEGNFVDPTWFRYYDEAPIGGLICQSWDTASKTGVSSDFSVGITARYFQKRYYILDVYRERVDFVKLRARVNSLCQQHSVGRLLIEDASSGQQLIQLLRHDRPHWVPLPIACKPDGDKKSRFAAQASRIEAGEVLLPRGASWLAQFITEIIGFPNAGHDDQADALAQMLGHSPREELGIAGPILHDTPYFGLSQDFGLR
jgi:predicted phage terminase large subunit-like protein